MHAPGDGFEFPPIRALLDQLGIRLSKHRDQHFLRNPGVTRRIAELAEATPECAVLEIGAGLGNLSTELARRAGTVVSVEMDESFRAWHQQLRAPFPNLRVEYGDFLKHPLDDFAAEFAGRPLLAVGNLPYQITAPILFRLAKCGIPFRRMVFMVQYEVAERMAAGPTTRRASALTYKLALLYTVRLALAVAPGEFLPPPRVRSAVVVLEPLEEPLVRDAEHRERLFALLTAVFQYRRKNLANGMVLGGMSAARPAAEEVLRAAGIDPARRPETLTLDEVLALEARLAEASGAGRS